MIVVSFMFLHKNFFRLFDHTIELAAAALQPYEGMHCK